MDAELRERRRVFLRERDFHGLRSADRLATLVARSETDEHREHHLLERRQHPGDQQRQGSHCRRRTPSGHRLGHSRAAVEQTGRLLRHPGLCRREGLRISRRRSEGLQRDGRRAGRNLHRDGNGHPVEPTAAHERPAADVKRHEHVHFQSGNVRTPPDAHGGRQSELRVRQAVCGERCVERAGAILAVQCHSGRKRSADGIPSSDATTGAPAESGPAPRHDERCLAGRAKSGRNCLLPLRHARKARTLRSRHGDLAGPHFTPERSQGISPFPRRRFT
jgi:hypothetical protein